MNRSRGLDADSVAALAAILREWTDAGRRRSNDHPQRRPGPGLGQPDSNFVPRPPALAGGGLSGR